MATYFVKIRGNKVLEGLSDANAWEPTAKVNGTACAHGTCTRC